MFKSVTLLCVLAYALPSFAIDAKLGKLPWHAALNFKVGKDTRVCSGVIIHRKYILTAAQCMWGASSVMVQLGTLNYDCEGLNFTLPSSHFIPHHCFDIDTLENDIALVRLPLYLDTDDKTIVGIPIVPENVTEFSKLIVSGWGMSCPEENDAKCHTTLLNYAEVEEVMYDDCEQTYIPLPLPNITGQNMCTKFKSDSKCIVDPGSPLVEMESGLVAIVSYSSPEGCQHTNPIVYTKVSDFCSWISKKTGDNLCPNKDPNVTPQWECWMDRGWSYWSP